MDKKETQVNRRADKEADRRMHVSIVIVKENVVMTTCTTVYEVRLQIYQGGGAKYPARTSCSVVFKCKMKRIAGEQFQLLANGTFFVKACDTEI